MKLNMDRRRFLIRGIDDYERVLDAIGLDSDESDESSVVDSEIDVGLLWLMIWMNKCRHQMLRAAKFQVCFATQVQTQVKFRRKPSRHRCLPT